MANEKSECGCACMKVENVLGDMSDGDFGRLMRSLINMAKSGEYKNWD